MLLPTKFLHWIYSFIPNRISNHTVIIFYEFLRKGQKLIKNDSQKHFISNQHTFSNHLDCIKQNNGYIEDQNRYTDMSYGKTSIKHSGCAMLAVYNATSGILVQPFMDLPMLISHFEKDGMTLNGRTGTAPMAIHDFLNEQGFHTTFTTKEKDFDTLATACQSLILMMYNDKNDIRKGLHFIHISKSNDMYTAHNVHGNGTCIGPYPTYHELMHNINHGNAKGIFLLGIYKDTGQCCSL